MITSEQAAEIARTDARELGWSLSEPLAITERRTWGGKLKSYNIVSDPTLRGSKARFTIDATDGKVLERGYLPR